jgi:hypothetical protein
MRPARTAGSSVHPPAKPPRAHADQSSMVAAHHPPPHPHPQPPANISKRHGSRPSHVPRRAVILGNVSITIPAAPAQR